MLAILYKGEGAFQIGPLKFESGLIQYIDEKKLNGIDLTQYNALEIRTLTDKEYKKLLKPDVIPEIKLIKQPDPINDATINAPKIKDYSKNLSPKYNSDLDIIPNQVPIEGT